jgi:hypothetical protein
MDCHWFFSSGLLVYMLTAALLRAAMVVMGKRESQFREIAGS